MEATVRRYVTEQEFLSWPQTHEHVELLDGEVIVTPPPLWHHQRLVGSLYLALTAWAHGRQDASTVGRVRCVLAATASWSPTCLCSRARWTTTSVRPS